MFARGNAWGPLRARVHNHQFQFRKHDESSRHQSSTVNNPIRSRITIGLFTMLCASGISSLKDLQCLDLFLESTTNVVTVSLIVDLSRQAKVK